MEERVDKAGKDICDIVLTLDKDRHHIDKIEENDNKKFKTFKTKIEMIVADVSQANFESRNDWGKRFQTLQRNNENFQTFIDNQQNLHDKNQEEITNIYKLLNLRQTKYDA